MASVLSELTFNALPQLGVNSSLPGGLQGWLGNAAFVPVENEGESSLRLRVENYADLVPYLSYDYERFALAAAQSFSNSIRQEGGGLPQTSWRLLMLYYGAFFSAHAVLRSQGFGGTFLQSSITRRVNELVSLYDENFQLLDPGPSSFAIFFPTSGPTAFVKFEKPSIGRGVHDSFWREFCRMLSELATRAVEIGTPDADEFLAGVDEISNGIRFGGEESGAWLPQIRNEINYHQSYDTWFPQTKNSVAREAVNTIRLAKSDSFRLDYSKTKQPIEAFVDLCNFLCCLSLEIGDFVARRSTRGGAFGQKWRRLLTLAGNLS